MSIEEHRSAILHPIAAYVLTLSDSRDASTDTSGAALRDMLRASGHEVAGSTILREDRNTLCTEISKLLDTGGFDVLIATGGTGIAPRDVAYEVFTSLYEGDLPGFGELFRMLSYQEIGSAALLSRASAGMARGKLLFSLPGSTAAVQLAMQKLLLPELGHLVRELRRTSPPEQRP